MASARRLRSVFYLAVAFAAGFGTAALAWAAAVRPYTSMLVSSWKFEQEFLADRAARSGDQLAELVHRWNAASAASGDGFETFRRQQESAIQENLFLPAAMWALSRVRPDPEAAKRGARLDESILRGKLALILERAGWPDAAEGQLARGVELGAAKDPERLRSLSTAVPPLPADLEPLYLDPAHR